MTKLTLSVDKEVAAKAKEIASANHTSVSAMFSNFVRTMAARDVKPDEIGPITRRLTGIINVPPGKDFNDLLEEALLDKYGISK